MSLLGAAGCGTDSPDKGPGCVPGWPSPPSEEVPQQPGARRLPLPLTLSPDGSLLASSTSIGGSGGLTVWEVGTGRIIHRLPELTRGTPLWRSEGAFVQLWNNAVMFLEIGSDDVRHLPLGHTPLGSDDGGERSATAIGLSPDRRQLASVGVDGTLRIFELDTCSAGSVVELGGNGHTVAWTEDYLLVALNDEVRVLEQRSLDQVTVIDPGTSRPPALGSPDGRSVVVGTRSEYSFASYEVGTWEFRHAYRDGRGQHAAFSSDGSVLATFGTDPVVQLHPYDGGDPRALELPSRTGGVQFTADGLVLTSHVEEGVLAHDASTGRLVREFDRP